MSIRSFISTKYSALGLSERTGSFVKNVGLGFVAKGLSILISFIQIPLILSILSKTEYGIWITIFSVTGWLSFFDIGMGNGFRNQLTEALAVNDTDKAKKLVSTIYISMFGIFSAVVIVFIIASNYISWVDIFNAPQSLETQLYYTVIISVSAAALNFVLALIHIILAAKHQTGKSGILFLIGQLLTLLFIIYYKSHQSGYNFLILSSVLSVVPLLVNIGINIYLFFSDFRNMSPSINHYKKDYLKGLMNLGIMFFLIQISGLVIYSTDNFLINKLFGPETVTKYSLVYKYFSIISVSFSLISAPLWTMYVDAFSKKDFFWVEKNLKFLLKAVIISTIIIIIMNLIAPIFFKIWIGDNYDISYSMNILISTYIILFIWGSIWVLPLNATGKIKVQMIVSIAVALINIPAIYFFSYIFNNVNGVIVANIITMILGCGSMYIYYKKNVSVFFKNGKRI